MIIKGGVIINIKHRKIPLTLLVIYTALIIFFMFIGFDRTDFNNNNEYHFNLIPGPIPLCFPSMLDLNNLYLWLFNFGNFAAFIPFGLFIPMLYRCSFIRFITFFCFAILTLETLQMLTFRGIFDVNDVIVNALGAIVGFCAYKIGFRSKNTLKNFVIIALVAVVLSIGVMGVSESLTKKPGELISLSQLKDNIKDLVELGHSSLIE